MPKRLAGSDLLVLGIETSCDETAAAVVRGGAEILSNVVSSQVALHSKYGGVVPELASRAHLDVIGDIIEAALRDAGVSLGEIDVMGVTQGPGLVGALLIGISTAKAIAFAAEKPLVGVHHLEGHIYSALLEEPNITFPFVALVVSGGHTDLYMVRGHGEYSLLGRTHDDAAGEAFDKVAKMLGLGYPGGPIIDELSQSGNPDAVKFPRPVASEKGYDFSFSGLKTAVLYYLREKAPALLDPAIRAEVSSGADLSESDPSVKVEDVVASFQGALVDVLVHQLLRAARDEGVGDIVVVGGVAANRALREAMRRVAQREGWALHIPKTTLCTDNAAMIACAAYYRYLVKDGPASYPRDFLDLDAKPRWRLG